MELCFNKVISTEATGMTDASSKNGVYGHIAVWVGIFVGLYLMSLQGYLLFHTAVELFSIAVAWDIFFLAWNSRRLMANNYLLFLGISYLFLGIIDLLHTLAYKGMGVFPVAGSDLASQLWIAGRFVQSVSLLVAPLFLGRRLKINLVIAAFSLVSAALLGSIFYWKIFPDTYLQGVGLTTFKIWSEYGICLILIAAAVLLYRQKDQFEPGVLKLLIGSIGVTIASELAFTLYMDVYGVSNLIGHFLKVVSFYLIYRAIIQTGLNKPYDLVFREMKKGQEALAAGLADLQRSSDETNALLAASRALLEHREFAQSARSIFDICKKAIGAASGYVALLDRNLTENEVLFLDSGGSPCTVDPSLPMPIRGLRAEAYRTGKVVRDNDFSNSKWMEFLPGGHVRLENVMFAPLMVDGRAVGLLGLANKPGGFDDNDARAAGAFAEFASIGLLNSLTLESLEHSEERFRTVVETANDAIISVDGLGNVVHWNNAAEHVFGYSAQEAVGKSLSFMMPERFRGPHETALSQMVSNAISSRARRTVEVAGLKKDGQEFPAELSIASWETREGRFFTGILRDITRRKRAQEALQSTLAELERSNAELQQFAYVASHDLQEPLRMVSSYVQLLERRYRDRLDEDADDFIAYAVGGAKRMQRLISGLLQYSRVGTHGRPFELVNCETVLDRALANLQILLTESGAQVTRDPLPTVSGDSTQILQLFQNLIDNACKFRDDTAPQIHVSARLDRGQWLFSVSDNGIGIDPEYTERIFIIFQRLHSREAFPGTGLGLAICKKIVERHDGKIWVDFGNRKGTTFCFTIPDRKVQ
jgi:PAS domain S-box-containing protein